MISQISDKFGRQAVIVSMDARYNQVSDSYELYSDCGRKREKVSVSEHTIQAVEKGAGEILISSIDRDGTMQGYDINLIRLVVEESGIPVIGCGGAGNFNHMKEAFLETEVSALACGSLFNFGDNNPIRAKAFLTNYELPFKVI